MSFQGAVQDGGSASTQCSQTNSDPHKMHWGHTITRQPKNTLRVALLNSNGITVDIRDAKTQLLRHYIQQIQPDAIGLIECNVNWNILPVSHRLPERTFGWWENLHLNSAFYDTYPGQQPMQAGGVSLWSINEGAHRVTEQGKDLRGLGRWAWMRYKGRSGVSL